MALSVPRRRRRRGAAQFLGAALSASLLASCAPSPPPGSLPSPAPEESVSLPVPPAPGPRWTIRLHGGEDPVAAEEVASRARERFDEPVSVVDEAGEYVVELGEFASEVQAHTALEVARERGFPGASIRPLAPATAAPDGRPRTP